MYAIFYYEIIDLVVFFLSLLVFINFHSHMQLKLKIKDGSCSAAKTFSKETLQVFKRICLDS